MESVIKRALRGEFEAALCMLNDCIARCPTEHWDTPVAKYPFWQVVYHTLCFVDCYLAKDNESWEPQTGPAGMHPSGRAELDEEYPSRRFSQEEMLRYAAFCREKIEHVLGDGPASETAASLAGPSGFSHLPFSRTEHIMYSIRHVQHHTGQLGVILRRAGVELRWVKSGWRDR